MLATVRKIATLPAVPLPAVYSAAALLSFGWLLVQDRVHPLVVYLLQLYLSF